VGVNSFPYYENGDNIQTTNDIDNAAAIFQDSLNRTSGAIGDKPLWITETGWPTTGPKWNSAQPSVDNAKKYWQDVGCTLFGKVNTFWYILRDSNPANKMKFGIDPELDGTPAFDLTCPTKTASATPSGTKTPSPSSTDSSPSASGTSASPVGNESGETGQSATSPTPTPAGSSSASVARLNVVVLGLSMVLGVAAWMA